METNGDETLADADIVNKLTDHGNGQETSDSMTTNNMCGVIQLCTILN